MGEIATAKFVEALNEKFPVTATWETEFTFTEGKKYDRIVRNNSVYAFVDRTTNELVKAAGWRTPAKNAHGVTAGKYFLNEGGFDVAVFNADQYGAFLYQDYLVKMPVVV